MKNELVGISVGIVCALVIIGTILVPMVDSVTTETLTYTNEGMPFAAVDDDTHTITVTSSAITVDGEEVDQSLFPGSFTEYNLVYATDGIMRYNTSSLVINYRSTSGSNNVNYPLTSGETVTIVVEGSTATISSSDSTLASRTLSYVSYYIASEGDYVMALNPVVLEDSDIFGAGNTSFTTAAGTSYCLCSWNGTMEEVEAALIQYSLYDSMTISSTAVNTTDFGDGLYKIDGVLINYTGTKSDTDYEMTATFTYFIAPSEVVYDNPDYIGDTESVLLSILPPFTILAVLCAVTYAFMRNRD